MRANFIRYFFDFYGTYINSTFGKNNDTSIKLRIEEEVNNERNISYLSPHMIKIFTSMYRSIIKLKTNFYSNCERKDVSIIHSIYKIRVKSIYNNKSSNNYLERSNEIQTNIMRIITFQQEIENDIVENSFTKNKTDEDVKETDDQAGTVLQGSKKSSDGEKMEKASVSSTKSANLDTFLHTLRSKSDLNYNDFSRDRNFLGIILTTVVMGALLLFLLYSIILSTSNILDENKKISTVYSNILLIGQYSSYKLISNIYDIDDSLSNKNIYSNKLKQLSINLLNKKLGSLIKMSCCSTNTTIYNSNDINDQKLNKLMNIIYSISYDSINQSTDNLLYIKDNFLPISNYLYESYQIINNDITKDYIVLLFNVCLGIISAFNIMIILFLIRLYLSYKDKNQKNLQVLSVFKEINIRDINVVYMELSMFKLKYFKDFEHEITNSNSIKKSLKLSITDIEYKGDEKKELVNMNSNSKQLVYKSELTIRFIVEVLTVVMFIFIYIIFMIIYIDNISTKSLNTQILDNKFTLLQYSNNFNHYKLSNNLYNKAILYNVNSDDKSFIKLWNQCLELKVNINAYLKSHFDILNSTSTKIIKGSICEQLQFIPICNYVKGNNISYYIDNNYNITNIVNDTISYNQLTGLNNLLNYNHELIWNMLKDISNPTYSLLNLTRIMNSDKMNIILENLDIINILLDYISDSIITTYKDRYFTIFYILIVVSSLSILFFSIAIFIKLREVLRKIYKQEGLSKKLIGEIPDSIIKVHPEIAFQVQKLAN